MLEWHGAFAIDIGLEGCVEQHWLQAVSLHDCVPVLPVARQSATFWMISLLQPVNAYAMVT